MVRPDNEKRPVRWQFAADDAVLPNCMDVQGTAGLTEPRSPGRVWISALGLATDFPGHDQQMKETQSDSTR
jgi:hypothetical protein